MCVCVCFSEIICSFWRPLYPSMAYLRHQRHKQKPTRNILALWKCVFNFLGLDWFAGTETKSTCGQHLSCFHLTHPQVCCHFPTCLCKPLAATTLFQHVHSQLQNLKLTCHLLWLWVRLQQLQATFLQLLARPHELQNVKLCGPQCLPCRCWCHCH